MDAPFYTQAQTDAKIDRVAKGLTILNDFTKPNNDSENLFSIGQVIDDTYVYNDGRIGQGATAPPTDYSMAMIPVDRNISSSISWLRRSTPGTMGYFFDSQHNPISGILSKNGITSGTDEIPENAEWLYVNTSNDPLSRALDNNNITIVYGSAIPSGQIVQSGTKVVANRSMAHFFTGLKGIAIGDSITTYERVGLSAQNPLSNYFVRACSQIGAMMLQNYSIGGSTISQNPSAPTDRNPISIRYVDMRDDADFIMVSAGTNDFSHTWTPIGSFSDRTVNTFYGAMHTLCLGLKEKYVGKYIFFLTPIKRYLTPNLVQPDSTNGNGETMEQYADAIIEVCGYYGIPVMDRFRTCSLWPFDPQYRAKYMSDGTHPNAEGHIIMANDLVNFMSTL